MDHNPARQAEGLIAEGAPTETVSVSRYEARHELAPTGPAQIMRLIEKMVDAGNVDALEKIQVLHERVTMNAARVAFADALAAFQERCPTITHNSEAKFDTRGGGKMEYTYASLDHIARVIRPHLKAVGLSYRFNSRLHEKNAGILVVLCTLTHIDGYGETAEFPVPLESKAGMSEQQKHGAALTYARRQSLVQVLGITTADKDTDGGNLEKVTPKQIEELEALIVAASAPLGRVLKMAGVQRLDEILAVDFATIYNAVDEYRVAKEAKAAAAKKKQEGEG